MDYELAYLASHVTLVNTRVLSCTIEIEKLNKNGDLCECACACTR